MLSENWAIFIGIMSAIAGCFFVILNFCILESCSLETESFKYTTALKRETTLFFQGFVALASISLFIFLYTFNFGFFMPMNVVEVKDIEFFNTYNSNSIYEVLYDGSDVTDSNQQFGRYYLILKNEKGLPETESFSASTSITYDSINKPVLRETTKGKKNFWYHYYENYYEIVFPLNYKEK